MSDKSDNKESQNNEAFRLSQTQLRILTEIRNNPNTTKMELADKLNVGKTTIDNGFSVLKKYGFIEQVSLRNNTPFSELCAC